MTFLTKVNRTGSLADSGRSLEIKLDVGRTLAVLAMGMVVLLFSLILHLNEKSDAATAFFALGEAIVVGGLGVVVGEKNGATAAETHLH